MVVGVKRQKKIPNVGNLPMLRAMLGKRSSGAAGKHKDRRDRRARTRAASKGRAMSDW